jgi:hypothetical protein
MAPAVPANLAKIALSASHFMTWISSAIVVGITGYFLNNYAHDQHLIFEMVISALVLGFWLPSFVLPFMKYKFYYMPLNFVFSYLWLTAFVFAAQDYNEASCWANAPSVGHCTLKLTNEAFIFLAFFFTLTAFLVDVFSWRAAAAPATILPEKDVRPSADTTV